MTELYCQVGPNSIAQRARLDMLEQLVSEPFYDTLRTKEQLGYSVHCSTRLTHGILGFAFVVISGRCRHATTFTGELSECKCDSWLGSQAGFSLVMPNAEGTPAAVSCESIPSIRCCSRAEAGTAPWHPCLCMGGLFMKKEQHATGK